MRKVDMEIVDIALSGSSSGAYAMVLGEVGGSRKLPIVIGGSEAQAIAIEMEKMKASRPLTHDLFLTALGELGATVTQVVVTEMRDRTYFAELHLATAEGERVLSARPSDAIALAVRCGAPLFASDQLIDEVGQEPAVEPEDDAAEIIDEFKDFIENVSPEDFG